MAEAGAEGADHSLGSAEMGIQVRAVAAAYLDYSKVYEVAEGFDWIRGCFLYYLYQYVQALGLGDLADDWPHVVEEFEDDGGSYSGDAACSVGEAEAGVGENC